MPIATYIYLNNENVGWVWRPYIWIHSKNWLTSAIRPTTCGLVRRYGPSNRSPNRQSYMYIYTAWFCIFTKKTQRTFLTCSDTEADNWTVWTVPSAAALVKFPVVNSRDCCSEKVIPSHNQLLIPLFEQRWIIEEEKLLDLCSTSLSWVWQSNCLLMSWVNNHIIILDTWYW